MEGRGGSEGGREGVGERVREGGQACMGSGREGEGGLFSSGAHIRRNNVASKLNPLIPLILSA